MARVSFCLLALHFYISTNNYWHESNMPIIQSVVLYKQDCFISIHVHKKETVRCHTFYAALHRGFFTINLKTLAHKHTHSHAHSCTPLGTPSFSAASHLVSPAVCCVCICIPQWLNSCVSTLATLTTFLSSNFHVSVVTYVALYVWEQVRKKDMKIMSPLFASTTVTFM